MTRAILLGMMAFSLLGTAWAAKTDYECKIEVAKGRCWGDYAVHFFVTVEQVPGEVEVVLAKDEFSKVASFACDRRKVVAVEAVIDPVIWTGKGNDERRFQSSQKWITPYDVPDDTKYWSVGVCFHTDFANAPRPLTDFSVCPCESPTPK